MMLYIEILIVLSNFVFLANLKLCNGPDGLKCCNGSVWDKIENRCVSAIVPNCGPGFYGQKCRLTCPLPYFGLGCVQKCNCKKELCNHVEGCISLEVKKTEGYPTKVLERSLNTDFALEQYTTSLSTEENVTANGRKFEKERQIEDTLYVVIGVLLGLTFIVFVSYTCLVLAQKYDLSFAKK